MTELEKAYEIAINEFAEANRKLHLCYSMLEDIRYREYYKIGSISIMKQDIDKFLLNQKQKNEKI